MPSLSIMLTWFLNNDELTILFVLLALKDGDQFMNLQINSEVAYILEGSELGSELTFLAGSELRTSELDTSELKTSEYRFLKIFILASYEQELYKERYNADIRATNILLQGLPTYIYSLINHYTYAKDIWDNVKMLLEGSELTKEDCESQLIQLNSKFVNNMLPKWDRFVTAVKLNRGLRDSNYDQLYANLKQHEANTNENKMMLERFTQPNVDPIALMSNVSHQQYNSQSSTNPPSTYVSPHFADNTQLDSGLSPSNNLIENLTDTLALLTQSYKTVEEGESQRKARTLLLMRFQKISLNFHGSDDAKEIGQQQDTVWCQAHLQAVSQATAQDVISTYTLPLPKQQQLLLLVLLMKTAIKIKKFYKKTGKAMSEEQCMRHLIREKLMFHMPQYWAFARSEEALINALIRASNGYIRLQMKELNHALMAFTVNNEEAAFNAHQSKLYVNMASKPQSPSPTESDASSTVYSTCQSNDSDGELGAVSDHSVNDDPIHDHIPIPSIEQVTIATQKTQHKAKWALLLRPQAVLFGIKVIPLSNTNSGPTPESNVIDHPLKHMEHKGIFDSGCSGHMTGNRAHLEDYQELSKVGSVTFGGSKGIKQEFIMQELLQQNRVAGREGIGPIEAARTMLADTHVPTTFWQK
ncbi:hypothetical protein Tco_0206346 [Tanacetum coccineum]